MVRLQELGKRVGGERFGVVSASNRARLSVPFFGRPRSKIEHEHEHDEDPLALTLPAPRCGKELSIFPFELVKEQLSNCVEGREDVHAGGGDGFEA
jgi:hypothetical protein